MRIWRWVGLAVILSGLQSLAVAQGDRLKTVLDEMNVASEKFKSAEADFHWDLYERVVKETTTQTGSIYFIRKGATTEMGAVILPPNTRVIEYKDGLLRIFDPGANHITEIRAGANQAQYESFLTLGFGGSGTDLQKAWNITDLGTEKLNDGSSEVSVEKLRLIAKDPAARSNFSQITIWVDPLRGISLKQELLTPSGDSRTSIYTHIRYNMKKVDTGKFAIKANKPTVDRR